MNFHFLNCTDCFLPCWFSISRLCTLTFHLLLTGGRKQAFCFCSPKAFPNSGWSSHCNELLDWTERRKSSLHICYQKLCSLTGSGSRGRIVGPTCLNVFWHQVLCLGFIFKIIFCYCCYTWISMHFSFMFLSLY